MDNMRPLVISVLMFTVVTATACLLQKGKIPRLPKVQVFGSLSDSSKTKCQHYNSDRDIIAIKLKCCQKFYSCILCHNAAEEHETMVWTVAEFDDKAIFCGNCESVLSIHNYLSCNSTCPLCLAEFNPRCSNHYHYYFDIKQTADISSFKE